MLYSKLPRKSCTSLRYRAAYRSKAQFVKMCNEDTPRQFVQFLIVKSWGEKQSFLKHRGLPAGVTGNPYGPAGDRTTWSR